MDCIQPEIYNCLQKDCENGYECCSEKVPKGNPTFGLCVKQGQCDETRGIPYKSCKDNRKKQKTISEEFSVWANEGYNDDCSEWKNALWILSLISVILVFVIVFMYLKSKQF